MSPLILQHSSESKEYTFSEQLMPDKLQRVSAGHFREQKVSAVGRSLLFQPPSSFPQALGWRQAASGKAWEAMGQLLGEKVKNQIKRNFLKIPTS